MKKLDQVRLLFVCSGNICRSPMAEALARSEFEKRGYKPTLMSAGTLGIYNEPASEHAVTALGELDVDLSPHQSRGITNALLDNADAIIVMETHHADWINRTNPRVRDKVRFLGDFSDSDEEGRQIWDPIGADLATYRQSRDVILECVQGLVQQYVMFNG